MSEWKKTIISDVADFNICSVNKDFKFDVIEYIDTSSVEKGQLTNTQEILLKEAPSRAKRRIQKNDILISSVRPNLEHYYFVDNCKENTVVSTGFVVITPKEETYPYFLYCLLTTEQYTQYLTQVANSHTSTYPSFNPEVIENSILSIPDYQEQKRIADVLFFLDAKIENLRRQNKTLEQIAQTLFKNWFIDFEFPNAIGKPYQSSGGAMFTSAIGDIPEGWKAGRLGDVARVINGRAYKQTEFKQEGTPIVRIQNLTGKGSTVYSDLTLYEDKYISAGDLIYAWSATFGSYIWRGVKSIYHYHIWKLDCFSTLFKYYLHIHLQRVSDSVKSQGTGSIFTHITKTLMENQDLYIPDERTMKKWDAVVNPVFDKIMTNFNQIETLTKTRDALLPKLMSGQLRIKEK